MSGRGYTRRSVLRAGAGAALGAMLPFGLNLEGLARAAGLRAPGSLPDPSRPAGTPTGALPFDHVVVVMMENHSFDNYFGMLPRRGQPAADGFSFDAAGQPANSNPLRGGYVLPYHLTSTCQPPGVTQAWTPTHIQIGGGRMNGFAQTDEGAMGYWTDADIPFYYSLAKTFTLANRWFSSAPCQTYPNRRFLMAGTAYGDIATDNASLFDPPPPNGTIFDRLAAYGISWRNYFTDLPQTGIIPSIIQKYPGNLAHTSQFFADCASGALPAVSLVDPEFGVASDIGGPLASVPLPGAVGLSNSASSQGGDEENPQNITFGENFVAAVVNAVLQSPAWGRTLLVWTYDEHGGYYDHVPPPAAIPPDQIPPRLAPNDIRGGYDIYGPRVPAVVVSPYSRPGGVTDVVHDHTSILATIQAKWNLPAMTYRDANAATLVDFLDLSRAAFASPPQLAQPNSIAATEQSCKVAEPNLTVHPYPSAAPSKPNKPKHHKPKKKRHKPKRHRAARRRRKRHDPRFTG